MAVNLIELATRHLPDNVVERVSRRLGEHPQNTQNALNGALPLVLNGLVQRSAEPGGTSSVMNLIASVTTPDRVAGEVVVPKGTMLGRLMSLANDQNDNNNGLLDHLESMGGGIVTNLFGEQGGTITGALASHSGVGQASAQSLLHLAGPVLLAVLGQKLHEDGDGPTKLTALMSDQAGYVQSAMPSGLQSMLGGLPGFNAPGGLTNGSGGIGTGLSNPTVRPAESVTPVSKPSATILPAGANRPVAGIPAFNSEHTAGSGRETRWLPWLLLALGVIALIFFCGRAAPMNRAVRPSSAPTAAVPRTDAKTPPARLKQPPIQ